MSASQKEAIKHLWPIYGINPPEAPLEDPQAGQLIFKDLFHRERPTELEIGFGNGEVLATFAQAYPEKNFIGIDVHKPGIGQLLLKIEKYNLKNIRIFCKDAVEVLNQNIPDNSLNALYLFFPDPWPKRRHHKRRIVQLTFIDLVVKKLILGGKFHVATDWKDYAHQMTRVISNNQSLQLDLSPPKKLRPATKFEARGTGLGHQVWDFVFNRIC